MARKLHYSCGTRTYRRVEKIYKGFNHLEFCLLRCGQERFRSIAKSYFRRADGVVLMYDCTYEKSFLNVKDWLSIIEESSDKQIPIIIIGNKTDLRDEIRKQRRVVEYSDGLKLAKVIFYMCLQTNLCLKTSLFFLN